MSSRTTKVLASYNGIAMQVPFPLDMLLTAGRSLVSSTRANGQSEASMVRCAVRNLEVIRRVLIEEHSEGSESEDVQLTAAHVDRLEEIMEVRDTLDVTSTAFMWSVQIAVLLELGALENDDDNGLQTVPP